MRGPHDAVQQPDRAPGAAGEVVLHRPALTTAPEFALKLVYGEMAEEMLLSGLRVVPRRLPDAGFAFDYPDLASALRHELGR